MGLDAPPPPEPEPVVPEPEVEPEQTSLRLDLEGARMDRSLTLRRGLGVEPIESCRPPCTMTLAQGHYQVSIRDENLRTALHLDGPEHRIRIVHESREGLRAIGYALGIVANLGIVTALVTALIGAGIQDLGGRADALLPVAGIGALVGLGFGAPALGFGLQKDTWTLQTF